jgi:hypothetical protein
MCSGYGYEVDRDFSTDYNCTLYRLVRLDDNKVIITHTSKRKMECEVKERKIEKLTIWR